MKKFDPPLTMIYVGGSTLTGNMTSPGRTAMEALWPDAGFTAANGYTSVWCPYPGAMYPITGTASDTLGASVAAGVTALDAIIKWITVHGTIPAGLPDAGTSCPKKVCLCGWSQGSMVIDQKLHNLETDSDAPADSELTYLICADPIRPGGLFSHYWPAGYTVPILDYTMIEPPDTQYSGSVLVFQYDMASDWPDHIGALPGALDTNPPALVNAFLGFIGIHCGQSGPLGWPSTGSTLPAGLPNATTTAPLDTFTCPRGGVVNTYLLSTWPLPITYPITDYLAEIVASVLLQPAIEAAYDRPARAYNVVD
ncbi:MAG: PE-PPE domain-containing protein [Mycobacterium sp.]